MDESDNHRHDFNATAEHAETRNNRSGTSQAAPHSGRQRGTSGESPPLVLDPGTRVATGANPLTLTASRRADRPPSSTLSAHLEPAEHSSDSDAPDADASDSGARPVSAARPWALKPMFTRPRQTAAARAEPLLQRKARSDHDDTETEPARRRLTQLRGWARRGSAADTAGEPDDSAEDAREDRAAAPPLTLICRVEPEEPPLRAAAAATRDAEPPEAAEDCDEPGFAAAPSESVDVQAAPALEPAEPVTFPETGALAEAGTPAALSFADEAGDGPAARAPGGLDGDGWNDTEAAAPLTADGPAAEAPVEPEEGAVLAVETEIPPAAEDETEADAAAVAFVDLSDGNFDPGDAAAEAPTAPEPTAEPSSADAAETDPTLAVMEAIPAGPHGDDAEPARAEAAPAAHDDDVEMQARVLAEVSRELERRAQTAAEMPPVPDVAPPIRAEDDPAPEPQPVSASAETAAPGRGAAELRDIVREILREEMAATMEAEIDRRVQSVVTERLMQAFAPRPGG